MKLTLRSTELQERHDHIDTPPWAGEDIEVVLAGGGGGTLTKIRQTDADSWLMRWSVTGETYEMHRAFTFYAQGRVTGYTCRLKLLPPAVSPFQAMTPYYPDNSVPAMKPYRG